MIKGKRILLRNLREGDENQLLHWLNDPEIRRLSSAYWPVTLQEHRKWFDGMAASPSDRLFGIEEIARHQLVGTCGLFDIHLQNRKAELRIRIGSRVHWRQGMGTEAIRLLVQFGFSDLNLHRIYLTVFPHNSAAVALYRKIGFTEEGRFRESVFLEGEYVDEMLMGILRPEWK